MKNPYTNQLLFPGEHRGFAQAWQDALAVVEGIRARNPHEEYGRRMAYQMACEDIINALSDSTLKLDKNDNLNQRI